MDTTSLSLLARVVHSDDEAAWGRFVALYTPLLIRWGVRWGLSADDAADLTQDILVQLLTAMPLFQPQPGSRFRSWLWVVARNKHRERLRKQPQVQVGGLDEVAETAQDKPGDEQAEQEEREFLMQRMLTLLRPEFQPTTWAAFAGVALAHRPAADVAAELGVTLGAVYSAKFRVLRRLREEMVGLLD